MARRTISLSLPAGDPRSLVIGQYLDGLPTEADVSEELRRLLVLALQLDSTLADVAQQLARLGAAPPMGTIVPNTGTLFMAASQDEALAVADMLDFG